MRFEMARHLDGLLHSRRALGKSSEVLSESVQAPLVPPAEFSWPDFLSYLIYIDAEIEHCLLVQYLYAAYSLGGPQVPEKYRKQIADWQEVILGIAKEEMGHLISVLNVLKLTGAPLNVGREDFPWDCEFYPFPFSLEPLSLKSLACYVYAESPTDWSGPESEAVKKLVGEVTHNPHQVSALFEVILDLLKDPVRIPDNLFQAHTLPFQASFAQWGRGYHGGARGDARSANPVGTPNVIVNQVGSRDSAVASLSQIAEQGEACPDISPDAPSHFARFLRIFCEMQKLEPEFKRDGWSPSRNCALNPYVACETGSPPPSMSLKKQRERDPITAEEAKLWANLFNVRYRLLLNFLIHSFDLTDAIIDTGPRSPLGTLINATFAEMYNLRAISTTLMELPISADTSGKTAGPPFQMPYTLSAPSGEANRWRQHKQVLFASTSLIEQALKVTPPTRHRYLNSLREADAKLIEVIDVILCGFATKGY